ncbi:hypothetical protein ACFQZX_00240 [Mucilaginibacter litoreus]|uniref:Uncharacterized protein n=1 Tax=Mucilaginibacter litoreus TaxID=1048221 RepID=A0ABW3AP43_9SPHI
MRWYRSEQAACLITDTADVEIISSKIILYNYTNRNNGTPS